MNDRTLVKRFDTEKIRSTKTRSHLDTCKILYEETEDMVFKKEMGDLITQHHVGEIDWKWFHRRSLAIILESSRRT